MATNSNWPRLVAMSVVTRWRSTFSSSIAHFTVILRIATAVKLVSAAPACGSAQHRCLRWRWSASLLSAREPRIDRIALSRITPVIGSHPISPHFVCGHMPPHRPYVPDRAPTLSGADHNALGRMRAGGRFIGYETVEQATTFNNASIAATLAFGPGGGGDDRAAGGNLQGNAGEPGVGFTLDDSPSASSPPPQLADAGAHLEKERRLRETSRRRRPALPGASGRRPPRRRRPLAATAFTWRSRSIRSICSRTLPRSDDIRNGSGTGMMPSLEVIGDPYDRVEKLAERIGRDVYPPRHDLVVGTGRRSGKPARPRRAPRLSPGDDRRLLARAGRRYQDGGGAFGLPVAASLRPGRSVGDLAVERDGTVPGQATRKCRPRSGCSRRR